MRLPKIIAFIFLGMVGSLAVALDTKITPEKIASVIDHTYLKTEKEGVSPEEQRKEVLKLIDEAHKYHAYSVCVREKMVSFARKRIDELKSKVQVTSVIGFPDGDSYSTEEKKKLLSQAKRDGADEFDMVFKVKAFLAGKKDEAYNDVLEISKVAGSSVLKVILENVFLTKDQIREVSLLIEKAFIQSFEGDITKLHQRFIKTSTGFAKAKPGLPTGATLEDVKIMAGAVNGMVGIKPAGGINRFEEAVDFFKAVGSPVIASSGEIDAHKFRIGSSSLLLKLYGESQPSAGNY